MSEFLEKKANVVEILDSDDEDGDRSSRPEVQNNGTIESDDRRLENRSFWKAGVFDVGPVKWTPSQGLLHTPLCIIPLDLCNPVSGSRKVTL